MELTDKRGWASFLECCSIISASLPEGIRTTILAARREGITGPEFVRIFMHAFEAAIDASRDENTWRSFTDILRAAETQLAFRCPRTNSVVQAPTNATTLAVEPRVVFDSFARCFACAVARSKSIPPEPTLLAKEFVRCRQAWESETFEYDIIASITGVHLHEFDTVKIADGLSLAWADQVLPESSKHHLERFGVSPLRPRSPTAIVGRRRIAKADDLDTLVKGFAADVTRCVTAIRLTTGKTIGCDTIHVLPSESHYQSFNSLVNYIWPNLETTVYGNPDVMGSELTDVELAETRKIASLLSRSAAKQLAIAVERLNHAMGRLTPEDEVIDLAIALESTLCRGGGNEQLSYRFRVFGAAVLADAPGGEHAVKMLGSLYTARSKVVHAGKRLSDLANDREQKKLFLGRSVPEFVGECRELARRVVLDFLWQADAGRRPEDYVGALERIMVRTAKKSLYAENSSLPRPTE